MRTGKEPMTAVLGVDPGGRATGIVCCFGPDLAHHEVCTRTEGDPIDAWIADMVADVRRAALGMSGLDCIAVEGVVRPGVWHNGRRQMIDPVSLFDTAAVMGAVIGFAHVYGYQVTVVRPRGNGAAPREAYPAVLWGVREGPAGTGKLRHCRSAYDVAQAAIAERRMTAA
jgi:hypothetical protein